MSAIVAPGVSAGGDKTIIASNAYGVYAIPAAAAHRPAARATIAGAVWEEETLAFIRRCVGPGDIIHAGAFFGDFLPPLSAALRPGARIWAFEPAPLNFCCARRTVLLNRLDNIELRPAGLGERAARRQLLLRGPGGSDLGGGSFFIAPGVPAAAVDTVEAEIVRIDDTIPRDRDIAIVHLDVEGYELKALRGAVATIRRCRPIVLFEANRPTLRCTQWLARFDYRILGMVNGNLALRPAEKDVALEPPL